MPCRPPLPRTRTVVAGGKINATMPRGSDGGAVRRRGIEKALFRGESPEHVAWSAWNRSVVQTDPIKIKAERVGRVVAGLSPCWGGVLPRPLYGVTSASPTDRRSIFTRDSSSSSRTNSGYIARSPWPVPQSGGVSSGKSPSMPPAAQEASRPGSPFSTTSTRSPCCPTQSASERPMMPAPTTIASQVFTFSF